MAAARVDQARASRHQRPCDDETKPASFVSKVLNESECEMIGLAACGVVVGPHPSHSELSEFLQGALSSRARRLEIVRHLLAGCPSCRVLLEELRGEGKPPPFLRDRRSGKQRTVSGAAFDYSAPFVAVEQTLQFFFSEGRPVAEPPRPVLAELGRIYEKLEPDLIALTPERSAIPFLARWLIAKSHSRRYASPREMLEWALMSRLVAEGCSTVIAGSAQKLADLQACAEAQLANALRVLGRSDEAEAVMRSAWEHTARGSGDTEIRASLLRKEASLFILQRQLAKTFDNLQEASEILKKLEMREDLANVGVLKALAFGEAGEFDREADLLEGVLHSVDLSQDAHLPFLIRNNLLDALIKSGKRQRALAALPEARDSAGDPKQQDSIHLRLLWNEGRLLVALGMLVPAERTFLRVRAGFWGQGLLHESVLVTQDLVRVQRELDKWDAAEESIAATSVEVRLRRSGPEVIQALDHLQSISP